MSTLSIPFNKPTLAGEEYEYIAEAIRDGHISGDGTFTKRCHAWLETYFNAPRVLLTTSCTHALEMAALLLDIQPGDEVIVPSFTFVSTVNAFVLRGAIPVFADIRPDTLNLDESQVEQLITERTKAVVPVHYAGVGCEMDVIMPLAQRYGLTVVEDNAHGLFGQYKNRSLGTFGALATQSFHETKNISCGEGGCLVINNARYIERADIIRDKGTDRARFFRGQVDKYTWVDVGSSYLPSDLLAAFLYAQLQHREQIQAKRRAVWERYSRHLADWAAAHGVTLPAVPSHCAPAWHMFYMIMPSLDERQALIEHLKSRSILSVFHYFPLHLSAMGQRYGGTAGLCPVTERTSERLLRLPFYNSLTPGDQDRIIAAIHEFKRL